MYKLLLSWRYLRTRFIALASIISVTLGVATLIVVNSVMSGFVDQMKHRLHGALSDIEMSAALLSEIHYLRRANARPAGVQNPRPDHDSTNHAGRHR